MTGPVRGARSATIPGTDTALGMVPDMATVMGMDTVPDTETGKIPVQGSGMGTGTVPDTRMGTGTVLKILLKWCL